MGFQKVEFEFPDEGKEQDDLEIEGSGAIEVDVGGRGKNTRGEDIKKPDVDDTDDVELEIIDDTPKADRGRTASEPPEEISDEELENYSDKVRNRIKHFSKGYHDERRAKEAAMRERQELETLTQRLMDENKALKETGNKSQTALLSQAKTNAESAHKIAQERYKKAYNDGDADQLLEAQEALSSARARLEKISNYKIPPLQEEESRVQTIQQPPQQQEVPRDTRAADWAKENTWFNTDLEMTNYALGLHTKLVQQDGFDPTSDVYYEKINSRMRELFPERFEEDSKPIRKSSNVVAPASRSTAPRKIRLTQTQVTLAKRLGLTNEQYAKQVAIDMKRER